ncbi:20487_t:CDS:1, partial [Cetraspora pellucida]
KFSKTILSIDVVQQPYYLVFNNVVKMFDRCLEKGPKEVVGFLASNTFLFK